MNTIVRNITGVLFAAVVFSGCEKEDGPLTDIKPKTPVTITNAIAYRPDPTVSTTLATTDSIINIAFSIPKSSGRTITEISKVAISNSYAQIQSTGTTGFYIYGVKAVSGTTATFRTSLREYYLSKPLNPGTNPAPAVNKEQTFRYYFILKLDDGTTIVPEPVRVLVL